MHQQQLKQLYSRADHAHPPAYYTVNRLWRPLPFCDWSLTRTGRYGTISGSSLPPCIDASPHNTSTYRIPSQVRESVTPRVYIHPINRDSVFHSADLRTLPRRSVAESACVPSPRTEMCCRVIDHLSYSSNRPLHRRRRRAVGAATVWMNLNASVSDLDVLHVARIIYIYIYIHTYREGLQKSLTLHNVILSGSSDCSSSSQRFVLVPLGD